MRGRRLHSALRAGPVVSAAHRACAVLMQRKDAQADFRCLLKEVMEYVLV